MAKRPAQGPAPACRTEPLYTFLVSSVFLRWGRYLHVSRACHEYLVLLFPGSGSIPGFTGMFC